MAERIVRHAMVSWIEYTEDGKFKRSRTAYRNDRVDTDTISEERLERLEALGAFAPEGADELTDVNNGDPDMGGGLPAYSPEMSDEEVVAYVRAAKVNELLAVAAQHPTEAQRLLDAEEEVALAEDREPRTTLAAGLARVIGQSGT